MIFRHGGDLRQLAENAGMALDDILDFSANINPLGPPKWLRSIVASTLSMSVNYPDPFCTGLVKQLAKKHGIPEGEILFGNGSTELLYMLPIAIGARRALIPAPAYVDYADAGRVAGIPVETIPLREENGFALNADELHLRISDGDIVFIGNPNNPTGTVTSADTLRALAKKHPSALFVIDEAFSDFVAGGSESLVCDRPENIIVMRSMTKIFAIPGIRLGYITASPKIINKMKDIQPPWSVGSIAQAVGEAALLDDEYIRKTIDCVTLWREKLFEKLSSISNLKLFYGSANYLLIKISDKNIDAVKLANELIKKGIAIRVCDNYEGLGKQFFRVAVRNDEENDSLIRAIKDAFGIKAPRIVTKKRARSVMFQGTSSNAGKSVMTAGICRILLQDGYRVAPFKAQNMSLNSFVTREGGEMGRAQVVQAQACRIEPDVRMNPLLLKPSSDTGSQVIQNGKPVANMSVKEYYAYKDSAFASVKAAYDSLALEYDVVVLEGAGSPAEVNLKEHEIVNMRMARYASAPVFIVGDIDLGGIFASFVGTMELLDEWERKLVAGFIINRFRGDASLLKSALDYTYNYTRRPVIGVVPYIRDLGLPEEDSVEFKSGALDSKNNNREIEIAIIDLPHISNFTDFDSLRIEPDVKLTIVRRAGDLGNPDAIILPGSKNVIGDLKSLDDNGISEKIRAIHKRGRTEIVGICGGFQMLGKTIRDPHRIESGSSEVAGLGILPISTEMAQEKTLERVSATHIESGLAVHGYEIHHGQTTGEGVPRVLCCADGSVQGARLDGERVWGTYLHGIFDSDGFRRWFIDRMRVQKGLSPLGKVVSAYDIDSALDRLADIVRASLPINDIYKIAGIK